jgi:hypothetical protein
LNKNKIFLEILIILMKLLKEEILHKRERERERVGEKWKRAGRGRGGEREREREREDVSERAQVQSFKFFSSLSTAAAILLSRVAGLFER